MIISADRERAWRFRPACYNGDESTKKSWMEGKYDEAAPIIGAFAQHRICHVDEALAKAPDAGNDGQSTV